MHTVFESLEDYRDFLRASLAVQRFASPQSQSALADSETLALLAVEEKALTDQVQRRRYSLYNL